MFLAVYNRGEVDTTPKMSLNRLCLKTMLGDPVEAEDGHEFAIVE